MGFVKEHLISLISKQVNDRGVVVWYDPERKYFEFAKSLELTETHIAQSAD